MSKPVGPKRFLITTLVIGEEIEALSAYTLPTMEDYALRVGADFKVMGKTGISETLSPYYEKNQIFDFFDEYEKVLYIDSDILVSPDAPDLFSLHDGDRVMAIEVENVYKAATNEKNALNNTLGEVEWTAKYFNSGVVLFTEKYKSLLNTTDGLIDKWIDAKKNGQVSGLNDQSIFNYRVNQQSIPMQYVDHSFNYTKAWGSFNKRFSKYFIHYAGLKGRRLKMIKRDSALLKSTATRKLLSKSPALVSILDKF